MKSIIRIAIWVSFMFILAMFATAQSGNLINSDGVSVRNNAPENVFFLFPMSDTSNVNEIQIGCSNSPVNHNYISVYEEVLGTSNFATYSFPVTVLCNGTPSNSSFTLSLDNPITVNTPDHAITIENASWTVVRKSSRTGYYWAASGGNAQITVDGPSMDTLVGDGTGGGGH